MSAPCVIRRGARFEGLLSFESGARVEGQLVGSVVGDGVLEVGQDAQVEAQVEVDTLDVAGELTGEVSARTKIVVGPRARIRGRFETTALEVSEGASIEGPVSMTGVD